MIYKNKNFCRGKINNYEINSGDEFIDCNFSRSVPHTKIFEGLTGLTFTSCNLVNCDIPADATKDKCLHVHKSMCSHLNPKRLASGEITECAEDCEHVVDSDELFPDFTVYKYEGKVVV